MLTTGPETTLRTTGVVAWARLKNKTNFHLKTTSDHLPGTGHRVWILGLLNLEKNILGISHSFRTLGWKMKVVPSWGRPSPSFIEKPV